MRVLVTGGLGFIGSNFVRFIYKKVDFITIVDIKNYAASIKNIEGFRCLTYVLDVTNKNEVNDIIKEHNIDTVVNFAAETHVDRSIESVSPFIRNVTGVISLLEIKRNTPNLKFYHISTDEVYGSSDIPCKEDFPLTPMNPYSASKASGDLFIKAFENTYKTKVTIIRPCNNYGPRQYPEKLVPKVIKCLLNKEKIPVYSGGRTIREWMYVEDCCEAIWTIIQKGKEGEIYNVSTNVKKSTLEVIDEIYDILKKLNIKTKKILDFTAYRPGIDFQYSMDSSKIRNLGWKPRFSFKKGLLKTVKWYLKTGGINGCQ